MVNTSLIYLACTSNCIECTTATNCFACEESYLLDTIDSTTVNCVTECRIGYFADIATETCVSDCGLESYTNISSSSLICRHCDFRCLSCTGPSNAECLECDIGKQGVIEDGSSCICAANYDTDIDKSICIPLPCLDLVYTDCQCPNGYFFGRLALKCTKCNSLCLTCFGPSSNECLKCDTSKSLAVKNKPTTCVLNCDEGYYNDFTSCQCIISYDLIVCISPCKECLGRGSRSCLSCLSFNQVLYDYTCLNQCPLHYTPLSGVCYCTIKLTALACHESCEKCFNLASDGCVSCKEGRYLHGNQCLTQCPSGFYPDFKECLPCSSSCVICNSGDNCIACADYYYKSNNICKSIDDCYDGTYGDRETSTCKECSEACIGCTGRNNDQCSECNYIKGYRRDQSGACQVVSCTEGSYVEIDKESKVISCASCPNNCKSCDNSQSCIECKSNTIAKSTQNGTICETCSVGYYSEKGKCKGIIQYNHVEICGDGLNLGQNECDDGNKVDGDGCSSDCRIEYGFECKSYPNSPDICIDVLAPTGIVKFKSITIISVIFSEPILLKVSSEILKKTIDVTLLKKCEFTWKLLTTFPKNTILTELQIEILPQCTLRGGESCTLAFKNKEFVTDLNGNPLETEIIKMKLPRSIHEESEGIKVVGEVINAASTYAVIAMLGLSLIQGYAIGPLWHFINMVQMLSYIPLLDCNVPNIFKLLLTEYLTITKIAIPFNLIPDFPSNPLSQFTRFLTEPLNEKFGELKYESISFIFNFSEELLTWIVLGLIYLLLKVLYKRAPKFLYMLCLIFVVSQV